MRHEMFLSRKMGDISNSFFDKFFQESPYNLKKFAKNVVENTPRNSTRFFFVTHRIAPSLDFVPDVLDMIQIEFTLKSLRMTVI